MSQTHTKSIIETIIQTLIGTFFGFFITLIIFPIFGIHTGADTVAGITFIFMFLALIKNYLTRRLFNWMHHSDKIKFIKSDQNKLQSLFEGTFQTVTGMLLSFWSSFFIYPYFGLEVSVLKISGITIVFTVVSLVKNYFVRRYFEKLRRTN